MKSANSLVCGGGLDLISKRHESVYTAFMSYLTLEVEIEHGKVVAKEPSRLPEKGSGVLTIFQPEATGQPKLTALQALDALQNHLRLDVKKAEEWMTVVREARR